MRAYVSHRILANVNMHVFVYVDSECYPIRNGMEWSDLLTFGQAIWERHVFHIEAFTVLRSYSRNYRAHMNLPFNLIQSNSVNPMADVIFLVHARQVLLRFANKLNVS